VTPDDRSFAIYGPDRMDLLDLATGNEVNWYGSRGLMVFAPDEQRGALLGEFGDDLGPIAGYIGRVYEAQGGEDTIALRGSGLGLGLADWSPDGMTLATATSTAATLWDSGTGEARFSFGPQSNAITALGFGPDSRRIATGLSDGTTVIWDVSSTGALEALTLAGHDGPVNQVSFDPSGARLMTSGADGDVKVWNITPERVGEWLTLPCSHALAYSGDGRYLACGLDDGDIVLFEAGTGQSSRVLNGHDGPVIALEFTPDAGILVSASLEGAQTPDELAATARIWDVATGLERARITLDGSAIGDIRISPDGTILAVTEQRAAAANDGGTRLYVLATATPVGETLLPASGALADIYEPNIALDFSPEGDRLAGAGFSGVVIWSTRDPKVVNTIGQWEPWALAWRPDGERLVAVGSADNSSLTAWDPETGDLLESLPGTIGDVTDVAFSRDGTRMATSSTDGTIRLWHGDRLEQILTLATDAPRIAWGPDGARAGGRLAFSPDGSRLAYTADDGMVRVLALRTVDLLELARSRLTAP
jgi:WD40 repeat protein